MFVHRKIPWIIAALLTIGATAGSAMAATAPHNAASLPHPKLMTHDFSGHK